MRFTQKNGRIGARSNNSGTIRPLYATIIAELAILEEIKVKQMEDLKLKNIFDSQAPNSNSKFKVIDDVFKF